MTSAEYLDDLEAKAKAAKLRGDEATSEWFSESDLGDGFEPEDAEYIAAANPAAVLELIERVRTAERELAQYHKTSGQGLSNYGC